MALRSRQKTINHERRRAAVCCRSRQPENGHGRFSDNVYSIIRASAIMEQADAISRLLAEEQGDLSDLHTELGHERAIYQGVLVHQVHPVI